jgi:hypothetical protein
MQPLHDQWRRIFFLDKPFNGRPHVDLPVPRGPKIK